MKNRPPQSRRPRLLALALATILAVLACAFALPTSAQADGYPYAHATGADGKEIAFSSIDEAIDYSRKNDGATIVMDVNWFLEEKTIYIPENSKVTIDMNGRAITAHNSAFVLCEKAQLKLTSSKKESIPYFGYSSKDGSGQKYTATTGGLVTCTVNKCPAIKAQDNSVLTLDGVTLAGCETSWDGTDKETDMTGNGAVTLDFNATLVMTNGASIEHNKSIDGGGVFVEGSYATIKVDNSSISNNYANETGGGIFCRREKATIILSNNGKIENNTAQCGGGIYFVMGGFTVKGSTDGNGKGYISGNRAEADDRILSLGYDGGGAINIAKTSTEPCGGTIENLTITDNYSGYNGGAIEINQENTTVKDCVITGNTTNYNGGAIYVNQKNAVIDGCTITRNACDLAGKNLEGGGVLVDNYFDVKLTGRCVIRNNTRGAYSTNYDDVMLREGTFSDAYIIGALSSGSKVGIRTGTTGDRRVAKNFTPQSKDCLFADLDGYYISYGSDEGGDAWQRHATRDFTAKLNGEGETLYHQDSVVRLVAPLTKGDDLVFWHWDLEKTTGLYPIGSYIVDAGLYNNVLNFAMPQNDVNAVALYATRAKKVEISVKAPVAGEHLSATGNVYRTEGVGSREAYPVTVVWYEVDADGERTRASGDAKANTTYTADIFCGTSDQDGLAYSTSITAQDVTIKASAGSSPAATKASVDAHSGRLSVTTGTFDKTGGEAAAATGGKVTVKMVNGGLTAGAASGSSSAAAVAALSDDVAAQAEEDTLVLGTCDFSYAEGSEHVTISAPTKDGYDFCDWQNLKEGWEKDDDCGTVTIPTSDLDESLVLTAVYSPLVTEAKIEMAAPVAGKMLGQAADDIVLTCSNGTTESFAKVFNKQMGGFKATWSPEPEGADGTADYSTAYTAFIDLGSAEGVENVDDVMADGAKVTCDGAEAASAGFTVIDGKLYLAVTFEPTADKAADPSDDGKKDEDETPGDETDNKSDEKTDEGDADAGKDDEADGSDEADNANEDQVNDQPATTVTTTTTVTKAAKKGGTPSTGDATTIAIPAALLATSAICLAAARLSRRER